ncbi:MAG TPA: cytochrome P450 [Polyangiaceae bacterium]|nr:cytochrome P450 [Polyangiaceae bacterium]
MLPPGPRLPAIVQAYRFIFQPLPFVQSMRKKYGDAVRFHSAVGKGVALMDPALVKEVFAAPPDTFEALPMVDPLFGPEAVITASGERHKKLRKLLNPRFHGQQVKGFLSVMQRVIREHVRRLVHSASGGAIVAATDFSQAMALDVIIETVFGETDDLNRDEAREVLRDMVHAFHPSILAGAIFQKPWFPPWRRLLRARAAFDAWANRLIRARRARGEDALGGDVLGVILAARYEDGSAMTESEVRDQLITLLLAGHETSATALAWCVYYLARSPQALAQLRSELEKLGPEPSPEVVLRVSYLDAVVSETLRIEPIVTDVLRVCREPFTVGNKWTVPQGEVIAIMIASIMKDERYFREPERFRPERFLEKKFGLSEYMPFGGGARRCLGAAFAEAELALAIAELALHCEIQLASNEPEHAKRRNVTMGPAGGVQIRVQSRA